MSLHKGVVPYPLILIIEISNCEVERKDHPPSGCKFFPVVTNTTASESSVSHCYRGIRVAQIGLKTMMMRSTGA